MNAKSRRVPAGAHRDAPLLFLLILLIASFTVAPIHAADPVDELLAAMPLEQRVGQLFVIRFWGTEVNAGLTQLIETIRPGGVVLIKENLRGAAPQEIAALTDAMQRRMRQISPVPLLVTLDQEGRKIQRLRQGFTELPSTLAMGAITDRAALVKFGRMMGEEMRAVGVNMDLAPVVDLATTPNHPLLNGRTLGDDPARVGFVASALAEGMTSAGVAAVLKHFPGHGDVTDTHMRAATLDYDLTRLQATEIAPFLAEPHAPAIMLGHIAAPALDPDGLPASLSPRMVEYLRKAGYDGVLMTDALDMGAITTRYALPDAAVQAVRAGVDLILTGAHTANPVQVAMYRAVLEAVRAGTIHETRIDEATRRVLRLKQAHGMLGWQSQAPADAPARIAAARGPEVLAETYAAAVTLARPAPDLIPIRPGMRVGLIYPDGYPEIGAACQGGQSDGVSVEALPVAFAPLPYQRGQGVALAARVDVLIVFTQNADQVAAQVALARALPPERVVVVALGSPYDLRMFPEVAGYLLAYDEVQPALRAACGVLFGRITPSGQAPVRIERQ